MKMFFLFLCIFSCINVYGFIGKGVWSDKKNNTAVDTFFVEKSVILLHPDDGYCRLGEDEVLRPSGTLKELWKKGKAFVLADRHEYSYYVDEGSGPVRQIFSLYNVLSPFLIVNDDCLVLSRLFIEIVNEGKAREFIPSLSWSKLYISYSHVFDCRFMAKIDDGGVTLEKLFSRECMTMDKEERKHTIVKDVDVIDNKHIVFEKKSYIVSDDFCFEKVISKWIELSILPNVNFTKFPFLEGSFAVRGKGYIKFCDYFVEDCEFNEGKMKINKLLITEKFCLNVK